MRAKKRHPPTLPYAHPPKECAVYKLGFFNGTVPLGQVRATSINELCEPAGFLSSRSRRLLGVVAAVYLNEYATPGPVLRLVRRAIHNLAGVPSIVHALFGVGAFVLFFRFGTSILAASLTLAIMTLPVVIVSTREALQAVPRAFREACWNMGATRWQTIRRVVLPNAVSGILTGVILEVSRTAGETAPIMFTGAAFFLPLLPQSVMDQTMALSLHLFVVSTQVPGMPEQLPFGVALVLISMVLLMNSLSIALRMHLRGKKKW